MVNPPSFVTIELGVFVNQNSFVFMLYFESLCDYLLKFIWFVLTIIFFFYLVSY
ncbi:hypothetical protein Hanom_Chr12g01135671 [Helianthus anomalus]